MSDRRSNRSALGRRRFLKHLGIGAGVGLGAMSLPFLRAGKGAAEGTFPQRFVVFFSPNGTIPEAWGADGGETDFALREILEPLEPFRSKLLVLDGLDMRSTSDGPGDGHQKGMGHMLTGAELLPGDTKGGCDSCPPVSWASDISIDQAIANAIGDGTRFRSLELGVKVGGGSNVWTRMSYRGASEPLPPADDPYGVFERVFGDLEADPFGLERRRARRQSVVDFVQEDMARIERRLGREDRERFAAHIEGVREVERRLENPATVGASCVPPELGGRMDVQDTDNYPEVGRLQMDQIAMALACDLTRVASLQWTKSVGQASFPWLGISDRHHDLSHEGDGNTDAKNKLIRINRWYAEQMAYLLGKLDGIAEGDGTLLDHTCVLWINELGKGNNHTRDNVPVVLAGSAGGAFRTGRYLRYDDRAHNDLLLALAHAYGDPRETFGEPEHNGGALPLG